ncbi:hypothetical protein D3C78_1466710 [compost metagenome]
MQGGNHFRHIGLAALATLDLQRADPRLAQRIDLVHHVKRYRILEGIGLVIGNLETALAQRRVTRRLPRRKAVDGVITEFRHQLLPILPVMHMACRRADAVHVG